MHLGNFVNGRQQDVLIRHVQLPHRILVTTVMMNVIVIYLDVSLLQADRAVWLNLVVVIR